MELITTQHYGGNIFSFYSTKRKDIFMTINELALGFGYKSKKGIEEMLRRKPYLKENKYSFMSKVPVRNYGTPQSVGTTKSKLQYQEVRLFTERGIFEIGCISHTAKAEQFRDWVFNQLKMLKNTFTKGMIAHTESKDLQKMLHDAVFNSPIYKEKTEDKRRFAITNFNNLLIKTASNGRVTHKVDMTAEEIQKLEHLEHKTIALLNEGKCYQEIKLAL
jgi:prophage antirepressor-like protein